MAEEISIPRGLSKEDTYHELYKQCSVLLEGESDLIANMANLCAVLKTGFEFLWVGFYVVKNQALVLGPFQGPVACSRIPFGKGVCGAAWQQQQTIIVPDVELFPGHIACSSKSKSEIVVPVFNAQKEVIAVLDVDSETIDDFDQVDALWLQKYLLLL